jgi:hypothetical protein
LEFEARRRQLRQREFEAGQAQVEDRGISLGDAEALNDRDVASIGRSGGEAEGIPEETGSAAERMVQFEASLTPKPRFDQKANHRRYMREWRRRRAVLRKS